MAQVADFDEDDEFAAVEKPEEDAPTVANGATSRRHAVGCCHGCTAGACAGALAVALLSLAIFGRQAQLEGALLYDDKAAVLGSPIVQGEVPLSKVWTRDFWGKDDMVSRESHKSFRPLVTLTYVANHRFNTAYGYELNWPYYYHVVSAALHALVSALVVPTVIAAFGWRERGLLLPVMSALLFAAHPVHVESVQNMVGRAEVMMALFYLLGFLAYAHLAVGPAGAELQSLAPAHLSTRTMVGIGLTLLCTLCSMLCKETGVTLPLLCGAWDVLVVVGAHPPVLAALLLRPAADRTGVWLRRCAPAALARYAFLATGFCLLALWRKGLNGDTPVDFARKQNMAIWHPHPLWRTVSILWVWMVGARPRTGAARVPAGGPRDVLSRCAAPSRSAAALGCGRRAGGANGLPSCARAALHAPPPAPHLAPIPPLISLSPCSLCAAPRAVEQEYLWVSVVPHPLACDWSWPAITTVDGADDVRLPMVLCYVLLWAALLWAHALRRTSLCACVCLLFAICPFFLASNVLVGVGTCKAERVLYLPSLGVCMALSLALQRVPAALAPRKHGARTPLSRHAPLALAWAVGLCVVAAYTAQCAWYADIWRSGITLWEHALRVQEARPAWTRSQPTLHALGEYGLQLSWANRNEEAEKALERQLRVSEQERLTFLRGGTGLAGGAADEATIDMGGYGPLVLVYRMNGDPFKALACAEKAIALFEMAREEGKAETKKRELGLVLGGRALALFMVQPELAMGEMQKALQISNGKDVVVLKLAEQLVEGYRRAGADPAKPFPPRPRTAQPLFLESGTIRGARPPAAAHGGGGAAAAAAAAASLQARVAADPSLRALLASPHVQAMLAELQVNPAAIAKYKDEPALRQLVALLPQGGAGGLGGLVGLGGALQQPGAHTPLGAGAPMPESLDELNAWIDEQQSPARRDEPAAVRLAPVSKAAAGLPPELGPLPAYATGAGGDPLETRPPPARTADGGAGWPQQQAHEVQAQLPLGKPASAEAERAVAAFKLGARTANNGDVLGAMPHYCAALSLFATCAREKPCAIGLVDTLYIKLRLHAALLSRNAEPEEAGFCTAQLARRVFQRVGAAMQAAGDAQAAEYVSGVGGLVDKDLAHNFAHAAGSDCDDADAVCGEDVDLLAAFR